MRGYCAFAAAALSACASAEIEPEHCFVRDEALARRIAVLVSGSPDDGALRIEDQGEHWRVGRWAETRLEGERIVSEDRGFTFNIDKCTGAMSGYRSWP